MYMYVYMYIIYMCICIYIVHVQCHVFLCKTVGVGYDLFILCRLVRYRWVVPAGGEIKLKLLFQSRDVGQFDQTLNFEIVGTRRRLQLFCRGLCVVPSICREPRLAILSSETLFQGVFLLCECPKNLRICLPLLLHKCTNVDIFPPWNIVYLGTYYAWKFSFHIKAEPFRCLALRIRI